MTAGEIKKAKEAFARYGVAEDQIFTELMRAHYLDYVLFQNPNNVQYGISIDDLYGNMKKTADKLGLYEGSAEDYARMYTLALQVDPMAFAPEPLAHSPALFGYAEEACSTADKAGGTLLFAGADGYLAYLAPLFHDLPNKRIAVAVGGKTWKDRLAMLFPRGRAMLAEELATDEVRYNYIFNMEQESVAHAAGLLKLLAEKGSMDLLIPYDMLQEDTPAAAAARKSLADTKRLSHYYDGEIDGTEYAFLRFAAEPVEKVSFGEGESSTAGFQGFDHITIPMAAFVEAEEWNYDLYAYNGSQALQMILSGGVVDMDHPVAGDFEPVPETLLPAGRYETLPADAVEDYGVRSDLVSSAVLKAPARGRLAHGSDLVLALRRGVIHAAVIPEGMEAALADDVFAFRPTGAYTAEYLKLYLDGAVGKLFLDTMQTESGYHLTTSRLLRIPFPKAEADTVTKATALVRSTTEKLADAAEDYRSALRDGVGMMMRKIQ